MDTKEKHKHHSRTVNPLLRKQHVFCRFLLSTGELCHVSWNLDLVKVFTWRLSMIYGDVHGYLVKWSNIILGVSVTVFLVNI